VGWEGGLGREFMEGMGWRWRDLSGEGGSRA
jgi:hypothetical protein